VGELLSAKKSYFKDIHEYILVFLKECFREKASAEKAQLQRRFS
jgi:hypothetical protein